MKKLISIIVTLWAAIFAVGVAAQTTQMATLLHEGDVTVFYGPSSLQNAHAAAADGDVITLSAGQFDAVAVTKELTIRGAGLDLANFKTGNIATKVLGSMSVSSPKIRVEGIEFTSYFQYASSVLEIYAEKCKFNNYSYSGSNSGLKHTLINCVGSFSFNGNSLSAVNCVFTSNPSDSPSFSGGTYLNCYIHGSGSINGSYQNCIFHNYSSLKGLSRGSCQTHHCLFVGDNSGYSYGTVHATDLVRRNIQTPFKEGTFYELLDEFKSFPTSDGTEVGIYGGNVGFGQTPNIPQVSSFHVAPRTSADGKLSVEIEVQGIE